MDADVLLMDEPLSNLDALLRLEFRTELKKIMQDLGTTTIYVTHDQGEALSLGDRVAVMRAGPDRAARRPHRGVRQPGRPLRRRLPRLAPDELPRREGRPGRHRLHVGDDVVPAPRVAARRGGRDVLLGVRPENITVDSEQGDVAAHVEVLEPTGSAVLLTVDVGDEALKVAAPATFRARPGDVVHLSFPPKRSGSTTPRLTPCGRRRAGCGCRR